MNKFYLNSLVVGLNFTNVFSSTQVSRTFAKAETVDIGSIKSTQVRNSSDEKTNHLEPSSAKNRLLEAGLQFKILVPKKMRISLKSKDADIETSSLALQVTNISQKPIKFVTGIAFIEVRGEDDDGKSVEVQSQNAYVKFNTSTLNNVPQLLPGQSREYNINIDSYKRQNRIILKAYEEWKTWDFIISKAGKYYIKIKTASQIYPDINKETDTLFTDFLSVD